MIEAWSPTQVYAAEAALMRSLGEGELMARAVVGLAEVARVRLVERRGDRVVALVGPGNNGADALYAVSRLADAGYACAAITSEKVHAGARAAAESSGVLLLPAGAVVAAEAVADADLILDGVLGIGGHLGLPSWAGPCVEAISDGAWVISVDTPSGHDPGSGTLDPGGVFADETVTFSVAKPIHLLPPGDVAVGRLTVVDIGLDLRGNADADTETGPVVRRLGYEDVASLWPSPGPGDDKYSRGVLGVVAGSDLYPGAAVLTVTAAVNAGVGMVRYVGPTTALGMVRAAVPEAVSGVGRVQAWVIGPGLDVESGDDDQVAAARAALGGDQPVVVDAGGLELVEGPRDAATLLTPHAGECARILTRLRADGSDGAGRHEVTRAEVAAHPVTHARELAERTGATVLLKGATTIVVARDGPLFSQADAPAWLATAGAGDVLAGLCGALLAAGLSPMEAGPLAALVHGVAADLVNPGGPVRALAVAHHMPVTIAALLTGNPMQPGSEAGRLTT